MGGTQSSEVNSFIQSCVNVTMNILNENITNNTISCVAMNNMNVTFGPNSNLTIEDGNFNISQKANVTACDMTSTINTNTDNEFTTQLMNKIDSLIAQSQDFTSGFLATSFSSQESKQNFRASIATAISTTMRNSNISTCATISQAVNNNNLVFNGNITIKNGSYTIDQAAVVAASAKCIVGSIIKNINQSVIDTITKTNQSNTQTAEVRGVFESLGSFMQSMILPLIIICAIVLVLGGVYTVMKKGD